MWTLPPAVQHYLPEYPSLVAICIAILLYIVYHILMRYCTVKMEGSYDR